jgi:hypothetical protein
MESTAQAPSNYLSEAVIMTSRDSDQKLFADIGEIGNIYKK